MKTTVMVVKALIMACMFMCATASLAANGVWNGTQSAYWTNSANWSVSPYPSGNDTASFTNAGNGQTLLDLSGLYGIKYITFDTPSVAAYTNGTGAANSQTLIMVDGGEFKLTDTAANSQLFNCGIQLGANVTAQNYSFKNDNAAKTLTFNNVFGSAVGGGTAGDKTLTISGAGNTTILGNLTKGGEGRLNLTHTSSGTLTLSGSNTITRLNMNGGPNSVVDIGNGFLALNNAGAETLTSSQGGFINGTGILWLSANLDNNSVEAGKTLVINVPIVSPGSFELYGGTGTGTLVLNATNLIAGDIIYNQAGAISVWKVGNRGSTTSNLGKGSKISFSTTGGSKLIYTGSGEDSDRILELNVSAILAQSGTGKLKFTSPLVVGGTTKTLTLQGSTAGIGEISGAFGPGSGTTSLFKDGTGTWILSGACTYAGATTVNAGKLLFNSPGTSSGSAVTVNNCAILGGNTLINGNVTLNAGGMLAPGDVGSIGTMSLGINLTLNSGTLLYDVSTLAADQVSVSGALTVNGTNTIVLSFPDGTLPAGTNTLMTFAYRAGSGTFVLAPAYVNASLLTNATSVQLVVSDTGVANKIWKGNVSESWETDPNWTNGSAAVTFSTGDAVLFDDSASLFNVTSSGPVLPSSVLFNNTINAYTVSAAMGGTWDLMKLGAGNVTLSGTNTYAGQTIIGGGMLTIGGSGVLGNGNYAANIINNGTLNYASAVAQTNSGVISGGGTLISSGSGTLTLSGANTYAGATTVAAGTVKLQSTAGTLPVSGAAIWLRADGITGLSDGASVTNWPDESGNARHATQGTAGNRPLYYTSIQNGLPVVRFDGGDDWLGYDGTYLGNTDYTIFVVEARGDGNNNYILQGTDNNGNRNLHVGYRDNTTFTHAQYNNDYNMTVAGYVGAEFAVYSLDCNAAAGAGKHTWRNGVPLGSTADNTRMISYTGARIGNSGYRGDVCEIVMYTRALSTSERQQVEAYLAKKWQGSLPAQSAVALTDASSILDANGTLQNIGSLAGVSGSEVRLNGGSLTIGNERTSTTYSGVIADGVTGGGGIVKIGGGDLTLGGEVSNTFTGTTMLQSGRLGLAKTGGAYAIPGSFIGINEWSPDVYATANNQFAPGAVMYFRGNSGDHVRFELLGTTQTLGGIENGGMVDKGVIQHREQVSAALQVGTLSTLILDVAEGAEYLFAGYLRQQNDTLRLVKNGLGTQRLSGGNINYNGTTTVNGGELICTNGANTGSAGSSVGANSYMTINNGTTLDNRLRGPFSVWGTLRVIDGAAQTIGGDITLNGGALESGSAVGNNATYGTFYINAARTLTANGTGNVITGSNNTFGLSNAGNLNLNTPLAGDLLTISGKIVNQSTQTSGQITKSGAGTVTLSGTNTYSGATTVNGGKLLFNSPGTSSGSAVTVNNGAILGGNGTINGAVTVAAGGMLAPGDVNVTNTLTLANTGNALTLNGNTLFFDLSNVANVSDKIAITAATGKLVLNGANKIALSFPYGPAPIGKYTLMTCSGGITTNGTATLSLQSAYPNATLSMEGNNLVLNVTGASTYGLTWKGNLSDLWDGGELNWTNDSAAAAYSVGDNVIFDDTAVNFTVSSGSPVAPGSVLFNTTTHDYTVSAAMAGDIPLIKLGAGALTLSGTNTYTGQTTISGGAFTIGGAGLLGNGLYATNIVNNGIFNYASSVTQTNGGIISGGGTLSVSGSGTLVLTNANTYTGPTLVNAGVLKILHASGLGTVVNTTVNSGGTLQLEGNALTFAEPLTLYGTLSSQTGSNNYSAVVSLQTGSAIDVGSGAKLILTASTPDLGAQPFSKTGAGLLRLTSDPQHRGVCTVAAGTLELEHGGSTDAKFIINAGATLRNMGGNQNLGDFDIQADGTFDVQVSDQIGGLFGSGNVTIGKNAAYTLTVGGNNFSGDFSGVMQNGSGTLSFTKNGTGIQTLSGLSTYSGTTTLNGGQLNINNGGSSSANSAIGIGPFVIAGNYSVDNTSGADVTLAPAIAQSWNGNLTFIGSKSLNLGTGTVTMNAARTVTVLANTLTVGGPVTGAYALTKAGAGTLTLAGVNTYNGATTLSGGKLLVNSPGSLAAGAVATSSGTVLGGNGTINGAVSVGAGGILAPGAEGSVGTLSLSSTLALNGNLLFYDVSNVSTDKVSVAGALTLNGINAVVLSLPAGTLSAGTYTLMTFASRTGAGTFVLSPAYENCSLVLSATSLSLQVDAPVSPTGVTWTGYTSANWNTSVENWTNSSGAVLYSDGKVVTFDDTAMGNVTITSDMDGIAPGAVWFNNSLNNYSVTAPITNTAPLVKLGSGTAILSGLSAYNPSSIIVGAGTLTLGGASQLNNGLYTGNVINNGILTFTSSASQTYSGVISGTGALNLSGSGTLTLAGTNTYTGATTVNVGSTLALEGNISTPAGATLNLFGTLSSQIGNTTYAGAVTLQPGAIIDVGAGSTNIFSASTTGTGAFAKTGLGLLRLAADPNHSGVCTISAGTLELTGTGTTDADFIINPGATLRETTPNLGNFRLTDNGIFDLRASDDITGFDGSGLVTIGNTGSYTFTVGNGNQSGTFSGVIENGSGTLSFVKSGTGTQTLSGINTYTGTTTVMGGMLFINSPGSLSNSAVRVDYGCTLGGSGTISGPVTMMAGSTLIPGGTNAIATLTLDNNTANALTLNGNILRFDLSNEAGVCDQVAITGASGKLVLNGTNLVALSFPYGTAPAGIYTLMSCAGGITVNPGAVLQLQNPYPNATLSNDGNNVILTTTGAGTYGLTWMGTASGVWDSGAANWRSGSSVTTYAPGNHVTFDDTAAGTFTVSSGSPVTPGSVLFNNSASAYTVSAAINGTGPLVKLGTSTATLSGLSAYNPSSISIDFIGGLTLGGASQLNSGTYAGPINNNGTFTYNSTAAQILSGSISGVGALTKSASGPLTLSGLNFYSGVTTINTGVLKIQNNTALGTTANGTTVAAGATLELAGNITTLAEALTLNGILSSQTGNNIYGGTVTLVAGTSINVGAGSMLSLNAFQANGNYTKDGAGWLKLLVDPNGTGVMTINNGVAELAQANGATESDIIINNGGTLIATVGNAINDVNSVTNNAGGLYILRQSDTINCLAGAGKVTKDNAGAVKLTVGYSNGSSTFSGVIENGVGTMAFEKNGTGTQTLTGINTYTDGTTINGGILTLSGAGLLGNGFYAGALANAGIFVYDSSAVQTVNGVISGAGALRKIGTGKLILSGINTYSGATSVSNGVLVGVTGGRCASSAVTVQSSGSGAVATLGVRYIVGANTNWTCASLTTSAGVSAPRLQFTFDTLPSTNVAPLYVTGNVVFDASTTISVVVPTNMVAGAYPLMLVGGTLPVNMPTLIPIGRGLTGALSWGTGSPFTTKTLVLTVSGSTTQPLKWNQTTTGTWNVNVAGNAIWKDNAGTSTNYQESVVGDHVIFDDTALSAPTAVTLSTTVNPASVTFNNSAFSYTLSGGGISGDAALTKLGTNVVTLSTATSYIGGSTIRAGTLKMASGGSISHPAADIVVGSDVSQNALLQIENGASVLAKYIQAGTANGAVGAIYNKGSLTLSPVASGSNFALGNTAGGYGYYRHDTAGALTIAEAGIGANGGNGVLDLLQGVITTTVYFIPNRGSVVQYAQVNVTGGSLLMPDSNANAGIFWNTGSSGQGVINVSSSGVLGSAGTSTELDLIRGSTSGSAIGILNILSGGTVKTTRIKATRGEGIALVNFNGGTLRANNTGAVLLGGSNIDRVSLYSSGATIDSDGKDITISQALVAPTGNGVTSIPVLANGTGYIGRPVVTITGGGGIGATAVADFNPITQQVTGITITSPGYNYTSIPTVTISGGGGVAPTLGAAVFGPNTSGGLTKIGSGTLTLSAVNTYSGATVVNNGKLSVMPAVSCANSAVTVQPSGSGATAILSVRNNGGHEQWTCNGLTTSSGINGATAKPVLEFNFTAPPSSTAATLVVTGTATFTVTPDVNVILVNVNVPAGTYPLMVVGGTAPTAVPALTVTGGYSGSTLSWSGNTLMLTISGTATPITWSSGAAGIGIWNVNNSGNLAWKTGAGALTYYQEPTGTTSDQVLFADTYITANTAVTLGTAVNPSSVSANNAIYTYTLSGSAINGATRLTKSGGAPLILNSANGYTGGTTIEGGSMLNVNNAGALGSGGVTNNGILNIAGGNEVIITGLSTSLSGSGTNNVTLGTGTQTTYMNGNHTGFTGFWNIGMNAGPVAGRAQMNGNAQGVDNSATTINILTNATLWINVAYKHMATAVLNGGDTGEPYGQIRLDNCEWAGPIILAGPITSVDDAFLGSESGNSKISGTISELGGPYEVTKLGNTILTLTGNNTFLGPVWVKRGGISVPVIKNVGDGAGPLGNPSTPDQARVKLGYTTTPGALVYTGPGETTTRIIDMAGSTGGATLDHSGTNLLKFTSDLLVSGIGPKQLTLQGPTSVSTGEVAGVISDSLGGAVTITKAGGSVWRLSGNNTFSGNVNVNTGILVVASSGALGVGNKTVFVNNTDNAPELHLDGSAGPITLGTNLAFQTSNAGKGSIHNIRGTNVIAGNITMTSGGGRTIVTSWADKLSILGNITPNATGRDLYLRGDGDGEISGVIANGSTVNMPIFREVGTGTWTLSGTNTYSGMTTVNSGTLALKGGGKLASTGLVVNAGGSFVIHNSALANDTNRWVDTAAVTLNSGVFNFSHTGGEADYSEKAAGLVVVNGASTLSASQADVGRTSVVSFASLTRTGSGTINFTGEGLGLSEQNKILFTNMVASTNFIGLWATYNTTNLAAYDVTMGIIPASATAFTNLTAKGPSIIPDNQTLNARINEEGTSGGISLEGAKTNKINSLLQNTIFAATVAMTNKTLLVSDIMMAFDTGALTLGSAPSQGFLAPLVASGQLQLINQSTNVLTINASITNNTGASSLNKIGSGVVVLTGTNTYTGPTTIQQGVLEFGGSSTQIRSGVISGSGTLAKSGSGTLTLSAGNNYTGPTTISGGTLKAGNAAALGSATVGTTITSGGTLDVNGFNLGDEVVTVAGAGIGNAGAIINSSATTDSQNAFRFVTMTDDTTFGGSRRWDIRNNPTATFDMGGKTLTKTGANWFVLVQANVLNPGAFNIKQGAIQLANTMTMGGSSANRVTVQSGASLDLYALPTPITWSLALSNNATVAISAGTGTQNTWSGPVMLNGTGVLASATFVMTLSGPITGTGPLQKTGTGTATLSGTSTYGGGTIVTAGTLQLGDGTTASGMISGDVTNLATLAFSNPTTTTYSGVIRGVGAVTKQVNSTQILSGANTYSGATTVNAGTLLVNSPGSLSNSAVSVSSGASLGGNGTIYGIVNMAAGSILVPGDTNVIATLTLGNNSATSLTLNGNTLRFDLAAGDGDKIAITGGSGNVVVNGVNIVDLNFTAGSLPEGTYTLMTFASKTGSGAFALAQGYPNATLTADTTSLVLTVGEGGTTYGGLTWKGNTSSIWDAMADKNWTAQGIATNFTAADWVTFTDTASRFTVNSLGPVVPSSILFNNSANAYTVAAAIDGTAALVKQGTSTVTLSGVSTYNPSSLSIGAGTLALAGASQLNSGLYAANINNFGTFNYASSATQTLSGAVSGSGLLTVSGLGSLTLAGTNTFTGNLTVNNGTLVLTGSNALTTATVNVGATAVNNAVMKLTSGSSLIGTTGNFTVGSVDNGYGAVYIDGGRVVRAAPATIDGAFCFGTVAGGYGYFNMSNGDISSTRFQLGSGMGLARIANGIASFSEYIIFPRSAGSTGVLTIDGGSLYHTNASQNVALGYDGGRAELNMTGGLLDSTGKSLTVRQGSSNPTGIVSLCSGTLIVDNFQNTSPGVALLNFNGGLLTASEFSVAFLPSTMTGVYVNGPFGANAGGAMIDSAGRDITCVAPLRAPTGNGVTAISLSSQGSGYIGEPYVSIMGDGVGATAVANMVDDGTGNGTYKVGSVTVTSPGVNYTTATVSFLKGGASAGSPIVAAVTLAPTTSGGLTKLGLGTLTLSGTNTYTGTTTISNGAVRLGIANALPTNSVVNVRGGTYDLNGFSVTNGAINTTAGVIGSGSLNCAGINKDGDGLVTFTATQTAASPVIINGGTFSLGGAAAGLFEGRVNGAFELTLPNPKTAVRLSPVNAYTPVLTSPQTGGIWVDNSTYVYTGYIWNRSTNNATWTFCKNFDDGVLIKVDSTVLLNNNTWTLVQTTNYVMTPGPHAFEVRLGQGTGGVGQPAKRTPGAGFDPLGRSDATLCVPIIDPGDGSLLTLFADPYAAGSLPKRAGKLADASTVELAANTLLDLGTTNQTLAALSGSGAVSNGALTVTGTISPAGTNSFGTLTVKTNTTATLSGKLLVDVNATTNDFLVVEGSLTLSPSATVEIVDLLGLNTLKTYTLITSANPIVGTFADTTIPNPLWALRYTTDNKVQLYYKGGTMIRIM